MNQQSNKYGFPIELNISNGVNPSSAKHTTQKQNENKRKIIIHVCGIYITHYIYLPLNHLLLTHTGHQLKKNFCTHKQTFKISKRISSMK